MYEIDKTKQNELFTTSALLSKHDKAAVPLAQLANIRPAHLGETKPRVKGIRAPEPNQPDLSPCLALRLDDDSLLLLKLVRHGQSFSHEQSAQPLALSGGVHGQGAEIPPLFGCLACEDGLFDGWEAAVEGEGDVEVDVGG